MNDNQPTTKVVFQVPDGEGGIDVETLWAYDLGADCYELANSPFCAYWVSWQDVIFAPCDPDDGRPTFQRIVTKSGNKTVRIICDPPVEEGNASSSIIKRLEELGCSSEWFNASFIALNIPANVSLPSICDYLIETGIEWEYADPTYDELFPDDPARVTE